MRHTRTLPGLTAGLTAILLAACSGGSDAENPSQTLPGSIDEVEVGQVTAALSKASSCDDLLAKIQLEAAVNLKKRGDQMRDPDRFAGGVVLPGIGFPGVAVDDAVVSSPALAAEPSAISQAPTPSVPSAGEATATNGAATREFSETNSQVEGVDEADIVKTDGNNLYLLHGSKLVVVDIASRDQTVMRGEVELTGSPIEMFVSEGKAVVYSRVHSSPQALGLGTGSRANWYSPYTQMTVVEISENQPSIERVVLFQGEYVSSRRVGGIVRGVFQGGFFAQDLGYPNIEFTDIFGERYDQAVIDEQIDDWQNRKLAELKQTDLGFWIPTHHELVDGEFVALPHQCDNYYVPSAGMTEQGVTSIAAVDLDDNAGLNVSAVLGSAREIYSNADTLLLSQTDYSVVSQEEGARERTALHQFSLLDTTAAYNASGFVDGSILNQFSMDVKDDIVRIATTARDWQNGEVDNRVRTLRADNGSLEQVGQSEHLGKPGETIFSVRFIGNQGYVVTFRQTDPLYVIDLEDPAAPTVAGELEIPGFSNYLHPLGDSHLIGIGRDIDPDTGRDNGMALQIFDVSDPSRPQLAHKHTSPGHSEAQGNHKAFNYYAPLGLLTFPFRSYNGTVRSSLEVFSVSADKGIEPITSIDHTQMMHDPQCAEQTRIEFERMLAEEEVPPEEFAEWVAEEIAGRCGGYMSDVKRGVFVDDLVYSISDGGVLCHDTNEFTEQSRLSLPRPQYNANSGATEPFAVSIAVPDGIPPQPTPAIEEAGTPEEEERGE